MAVPRMIDETVPIHVIGLFGIFTNVSINGGKMFTMALGEALPEDP